MDLNQVIQLAGNPQVRQLLQSVLQQFADGQPGQGGEGGAAGGQGLMDQLRQAGLGDQVQSWLSTGPNQPVTGRQIQQALGSDIDEAAAAAGMAPEEAAGDLAKVVPTVVNEASPNGQLDLNALQDIMNQLIGTKTR